MTIVGVAIARRIKKGSLKPGVIAIIGEFKGAHEGAYRLGLIGEGISTIRAKGTIQRMVDIDLVNVAIARQTQVKHIQSVGAKDAHRIRPYKKIIIIKKESGIVVVVVKASLHGVAGVDEILMEPVGNHDFLVAIVKSIEAAVGVLLQHVEIKEVVLVLIGVERTE